MRKSKFQWKKLISLQWRNLPAAGGDWSLAFLFYCAYQGNYLFDTSLRDLGLVMQIEFLAIHSFPFLGLIALAKPDSKKQRIGQVTFFFVASGFADMPTDVGTWNRTSSSLEFGWIYFFLLGLIELTGFYQCPIITSWSNQK